MSETEEMNEAVRDLESYVSRVEAMIARIERETDDDARTASPVAGAWSLTEIVQHLGLVSLGMLRAAHPAAGQSDVGRNFPKLLEMLRSDAKIAAPVPQIVPRPGTTWSDATTTVRAGIGKWREMIASGTLDDTAFPHPLVGELTGRQAVQMLVEHFDRHARQMERLLAAAREPA